MRRILIASVHTFPRGGAAANYLQYLADALTDVGYEVILLACINPEYSSEETIRFHSFTVKNIWCRSKSKVYNRMMNGLLFWKRIEWMVSKLNPTAEDVLMLDDSMCYSAFRIREKTGAKVLGWPLEWFRKEDFESETKAKQDSYFFEREGDKDLIFPISNHIAQHFTDRKCKIQVLPIMADTMEIEYRPKELSGRYKFILTANGRMKDSLGEILKGMALLSDEERRKVEFHLTGTKEETIREILQREEYEKIRNCLVLHKWMKYEELIDLYRTVHFLFLARDTNQMTLSNFPSKVPEAMTYGTVPVVSRVGDYTQIYLQDGVDSLIFDGCSAEACKSAFKRALALSKEEYAVLSENARSTAETKFDYRNWIGTIRNSIESIFQS